MAGKIVADQLEHSTAGSLDTQFVVNGRAKAWLLYDGAGRTFADRFNGSSATDDGTGTYTMSFTSSMSNANYAVVLSDDDGGTTRAFTHAKTYATGSFATRSSRGDNGTNTDKTTVATVAMGDLT